jgi:hypothetical protein
MISTYATAITQYVQAGGSSYVYRRMGKGVGRAFDLHAELSPGDGQHRSLVAGRVWPGPSGHHLRQRWCRANLTYMKPANKPYACRFRTSRAKSARLV